MGLRGPKPKGSYSTTGANLSARIDDATRNALSAAASASGRSLSRELEDRLQRSFAADALYGPVESHWLLRLVAELTARARELTGESWRKNPFTHKIASDAIRTLLDAFAPAGDPAPPETFPNFGKGAELQAGHHAVAMRSWRVAPHDLERTFAALLVRQAIDRIREAPGTTDDEHALYRKVAEVLPPPQTPPPKKPRQSRAQARQEIAEQIRQDNKELFEDAPETKGKRRRTKK